jgi:hypothetical protein
MSREECEVEDEEGGDVSGVGVSSVSRQRRDETERHFETERNGTSLFFAHERTGEALGAGA